jgi:hypothetical protein
MAVVGVQRGEHQVPGFRGRERRGHGLGVAHLPTRITSGVWRMMLRSVTAKSGVSRPTSICSMMALRLACWYSTGSSMVTTCAAGAC